MSAAALGNRKTCAAALMVANLSIKQPWHTEYCHLKFSYSDLSADYATHYMLTPAKIYAVKTKTAPGKFQIKMNDLIFRHPDCAANVRKVIVEENIKLKKGKRN
jgi:hypothetical protein